MFEVSRTTIGNYHFLQSHMPRTGVRVYTSLRFDVVGGVASFDTNSSYRFEQLADLLSLDGISCLRQVHGSSLHHVKKAEDCSLFAVVGDGIYADLPNIALGVITADCFPLIIAGGEYYASLHCGWRSVTSGIIEKTIDKIKSSKNDVTEALIGVGICKDCYSVQNDMIDIVKKSYDTAQFVGKKGARLYFDLQGLIRNILLENGVEYVYNISRCTLCDDGFFLIEPRRIVPAGC